MFDGSYLYYAFSSGTDPKTLRLIKFSVPAISYITSNGHYMYSSSGTSFSCINLENDTNYIYAFSYEPGYMYFYLTKYAKTDLSIVIST